jgi:hypothetical protein
VAVEGVIPVVPPEKLKTPVLETEIVPKPLVIDIPEP